MTDRNSFTPEEWRILRLGTLWVFNVLFECLGHEQERWHKLIIDNRLNIRESVGTVIEKSKANNQKLATDILFSGISDIDTLLNDMQQDKRKPLIGLEQISELIHKKYPADVQAIKDSFSNLISDTMRLCDGEYTNLSVSGSTIQTAKTFIETAFTISAINQSEISIDTPEIKIWQDEPNNQPQKTPHDDQVIIISTEDLSQAIEISIDSGDLFQVPVITEPKDQSQTKAESIKVKGTCDPKTNLKLICGDFSAEVSADTKGQFVFKGVSLINGWNEIEVQVLQSPALASSIQVFRQDRALLFVGLKDPYSQSTLSAEDEVVRCQKCKTFARLDSWTALPGCAQHGCGSQQYWTRDNKQFFIEDEEINL